ncbi:DUF11 domain-containing protein [Allosphingosinicella flava]|uniref:DUF11 domain-containing protein n=1 Tax=Allosphingosinicella flava TaxID=2771430 RepID=A0A7T2GKE1_9SPHN|nr:DUF11 domain-containing protein [Sphingosinicella flava]QPQ55486.1 DUF11 domain-containing protein [Sphingosinicella flava]
MTRTAQLLGAAGLSAIMAFAAAPAYAEGTSAGTIVTNTVTLNYKVQNVDQNTVTATNTFTVDRKVNLTVTEVGSATTTVTPGETDAYTTFTVTNTSNAPLDLQLAATQLSGGTAAHGGTDTYDVSNLRIFVDTNNNGTLDIGTDQIVSYLDEIAADASRRIFVVGDTALGRVNGDVAGVRLTATAHEAGAANSMGAAVTQTAGANTGGVDTVFADTNADGNTAGDGAHYAGDDFTVGAAALTVTKTSKVISDPVNSTTNPKMIPGAVVEYCIIVANAAGGTTATDIVITDILPAQTAYLPSFGVKANGTVSNGTDCSAGTEDGSFDNGTVTATIASVPGDDARNVLFRVTVN